MFYLKAIVLYVEVYNGCITWRNLPSEKEVACYFKKWTGYETIVSLYFWRSISLGLQRTSFNNILSEGGSFYEDEP